MFIITGQDSPEDRDNSFSAGADQFLVKPVVLKVLDRELAKYFAASGAS
jgi:CheY-like chemotaxis protein